MSPARLSPARGPRIESSRWNSQIDVRCVRCGLARQSGHRLSHDLPAPRQSGHVREMVKKPCCNGSGRGRRRSHRQRLLCPFSPQFRADFAEFQARKPDFCVVPAAAFSKLISCRTGGPRHAATGACAASPENTSSRKKSPKIPEFVENRLIDAAVKNRRVKVQQSEAVVGGALLRSERIEYASVASRNFSSASVFFERLRSGCHSTPPR